jgi:hypothetical protein
VTRTTCLPCSYWSWHSTIDFVRWAWGCLMLNQFESNDPIYLTSSVLETFGFKGLDKWRCLGYQAIFFFVYFGLALLVMSVKKYQKR